ncbi:unnamed protein product [Rotaria magnacalcarata]|nr:unnamed protein product [Rotaria magnacalcarata]
MFPSLLNKASVNRLPSSTFIQQQQQQQQWFPTTSQQQFTPPPNYTAATRARYTSNMQQQQPQSQPSPQTLIAPLRSNTATPPPNYLTRTSSTPNLTRPPLIRPSQYSSQQPQPPQDSSAR